MKMPSSMQNRFSQVPEAEIPRSKFNREHCYKTTFDAGKLIPFFVDEVLPGSTVNMSATIFARLTTPIVPFMDNLHMSTFWFFCPSRLLWDNFQRFMGEADPNPNSSTDYVIPQVAAPASTGWQLGSVADYFGLPTGIANLTANALPFRAYNRIWNEWFRDQNLQDSIPVPLTDGPDSDTNYVIRKRNKRHDYFTSCLPAPQKGPAVEIPLTGNAPVSGLLIQDNIAATTPAATTYWDATGNRGQDIPRWNSDYMYVVANANGIASPANLPQVFADLSGVGATTINELRTAFALQRLRERDMRGGTRYVEILKSHFGVTSPDARFMRSEFLNGSTDPIMVTPVAQNSPTGTYANTPQGNLAAYATGTSNGTGFSKSFTEHGYLLGLICVHADLSYLQGVPKMFSRSTKYDFYWPALSHLGEQAVLTKEIYAQGTADDEIIFGYQERFAEYRFFPSKITNLMRSTASTPLDYWHLAQYFVNRPMLVSTFVEENPPIDRVVAVQDEPNFVMDSFMKLTSVLPMPVYSTPGLIDHF